jgi:transposase
MIHFMNWQTATKCIAPLFSWHFSDAKGATMYTNIRQWSYIRSLIFVDGVSRRKVARQTGLSRNTIKKMLLRPYPPTRAHLSPTTTNEAVLAHETSAGEQATTTEQRRRTMSAARQRACSSAYDVLQAMKRRQGIEFLDILLGSEARGQSVNSVRQTIYRALIGICLAPTPRPEQQKAAIAREWIRQIRVGSIDARTLDSEFTGLPQWPLLRDRLLLGTKSERDKALVVLCIHRRLSVRLASAAIGLSRGTYNRYQRLYANDGTDLLFAPQRRIRSKSEDGKYRAAVFALLHEPPSAHGINRTTWKLDDMLYVLGEQGLPLCRETLSGIIRSAGYRWRQARIALTSNDPSYREKVDRVREILGRLGEHEAFFSIDEYGPFAVKMKPGKALAAPGEQRIVPQFQKSKGRLIMTAALELSGNQVTHFYSDKKNTSEMIRMMKLLIERYSDRNRIYLSWDAASWHVSKKLKAEIEVHNGAVAVHGGPVVELAPLSAGAQFLNLIESVFSGMSRAIIHNSDYPSPENARMAIDRYFEDRNENFRVHPQRAGKKIWGKEREPPCFSDANNCKDPRYR